jgi:hypothetical protein
MAMSSFKSRFLKNQLTELLKGDFKPTEADLIPALCLFAGLEPFLEAPQKDRLVNRLLDALGAAKDKSIEARGLVYLLVLTDKDGDLKKTVNAQWKKFAGKYQAVCKGVLPPASKEHRPKKPQQRDED